VKTSDSKITPRHPSASVRRGTWRWRSPACSARLVQDEARHVFDFLQVQSGYRLVQEEDLGLQRSQVSRRDLQALTDTVRRELAQQRQAELRHITWHVPGLVWSLDDAELARLAHHPLRLHQVQDLASRDTFTPWVGERVLGETVAVRLEPLFWQHGPPLVLKRDNGSHLNQPAVDEVLARYLVMQGVSGCQASPEGLYSPQAKGGLRCDQRTDSEAHSGPGGSHPTASRNRPASGGGNLVTKQRSDHHHSEQGSVTHFPQRNRS
jgi:hypothetical protein